MLEVSIFFVFGFGKAGKTTMLEYFSEGRYIPQGPTIGVSLKNLAFPEILLHFVDVGGVGNLREGWTNYLNEPKVLIFVFDATDRNPARIELASKELFRILKHPKTKGVPLIFVINKIDLQLAMRKNHAIKKIGIDKIKDRCVQVHEISAKTGENINTLLNEIKKVANKHDERKIPANENTHLIKNTKKSQKKPMKERETLVNKMIDDGDLVNAIKTLKSMINDAKSQGTKDLTKQLKKKIELFNTIQKLKTLLQSATKLHIDDVAAFLNIQRVKLLSVAAKWSSNLNFKIDGDYIVNNNDKEINMLIDNLDKQFSNWSKNEKSKNGKI
ncbi:MAG: ADP-ribosylation factor-like protein [Promethearchaeota archaeon]